MGDFKSKRIPFIYLNCKLMLNENPGNSTCLEWVTGMGYTKERWANSVRGYISADRVQFFTGEDYRPTPVIPSDIMPIIHAKCINLYGMPPKVVYNGVEVGEEGEFWEPIEDVTSEVYKRANLVYR